MMTKLVGCNDSGNLAEGPDRVLAEQSKRESGAKSSMAATDWVLIGAA
jgi:hypothetical protein